MPASVPFRPIVLGAALLSLAMATSGCTVKLGADALYTASEERTTTEVISDNEIKIALNKYLLDDSLGLFNDVSTVVYQGRVLLVGSVDSMDARDRADAIGRRPEGVKEVINEIVVTEDGGVGDFVDDVVIEKTIQTEYLFDQEIDSANFRVRSINGTVYLIGLAESRHELDKALQVAHKTQDVRAVINHMRIQPAEG
jgi:osmotically-inducible protein OsmY